MKMRLKKHYGGAEIATTVGTTAHETAKTSINNTVNQSMATMDQIAPAS